MHLGFGHAEKFPEALPVRSIQDTPAVLPIAY